ncbi:MAG: hypothetical protein WCH99_09075 [Verrucomicrobiota bacterium]
MSRFVAFWRSCPAFSGVPGGDRDAVGWILVGYDFFTILIFGKGKVSKGINAQPIQPVLANGGGGRDPRAPNRTKPHRKMKF